MKTNKEVRELYYVSSKVFREQLDEYYKTDVMTNDLAANLVKIAEGLSYNWRFINYTKSWREEMVGDAILKMYAALEKKSFNIESEFNPFSYFNRIAWNAFANRIKREKSQHEGLNDYKEAIYTELMSSPESMGHVYIKPCLDDDYEDGE